MNLNSLRSMVERRVICLIRMDEEIRYKILRLLADNPDVSQRELAEVLGVSLGKANYCLQALKEKGLVKARNFKNNPDKRRYIYVLTPKGIDERATVAARFLKRKLAEYELLQLEIEQLRKEVQSQELPVEDAST